MSFEESSKVKLGKKEKAVIFYLTQNSGSAWQEDIVAYFSWAKKYQSVILKRLYKMQEKGLIKIREEINPDTGRVKKRVYLIQ